jgi:RNA polymerase sigma factor (sigma-70 family)
VGAVIEDLYEKHKGLLFRLAYQLTGSATDAEDIVQDVFVKAHGAGLDQMAHPKAYLCKMTTNRCLDMLRSARKRRELYIGPWLPEPIPTPSEDILELVVHRDLLSYAMLVLLERLSPAERAVFVLREALCFEYADIAGLVGKSEANCRKLISRARGKMGLVDDVSVPVEEASEEWIGLIRKAAQDEMNFQVEVISLNGQTGFAIRTGGQIDTIGLLHIEQEAIRNIYFVRNPDKMTYVKPNTDSPNH